VKWPSGLAALAIAACTTAASPTVGEPSPPGPVPDFAPIAGVVSHAGIESIAPELRRTLERLVGPERFESVTGLDDALLWVRDYQPLWVRRRDGTLAAVRYLHDEQARAAAWPALAAPVEHLPLVHEHGNLVSTGPLVLVTERLLHDNARERTEPWLLAGGYRPRDRDEVVGLLAAALDRRPADVVVLPRMPHEPTGHVDVFVLALDERTIAVPRIEPEALELAAAVDRAVAVDVQRFLDEQATRLDARGLHVVRPPMLPPAVATSAGPDQGDDRTALVLFTPANSLLLHVDDRHVALVPGFTTVSGDPRRALLARGYERRWRDELAARGWQAHVVDAAELAGYGGLLRCATAVVPR
jgi:hypothetical protein